MHDDITHKFRHVRYRHGADLYVKYGFKLLQAFFSFEENASLAKDGLIYDTTPSSSAPERVGEGSWFQLHNSGSNRQDDEEIPWHVANV